MPTYIKDAAVSEDIARVVRSAAHSAECPIGVFYLSGESGFAPAASYGVAEPAYTPTADKILTMAADQSLGAALIVNDIGVQPGFGPADRWVFGGQGPEARFIAAIRVADEHDATLGVLLVADLAPNAGLSSAKTYVLLTHAAQIATLWELRTLRGVAGQANAPDAPQTDLERLRLLESVVVNAQDAVIITEAEPIDLPGPRIVYCNAAFTRTTGYGEAEILGLTPRLLQSPRTDRVALDRLRAALVRWVPIEVELLNRRKDGSEFWVELSIAPIANEVGWFTHWVSVQRDVSERKAAEAAATRARMAEAASLALVTEVAERKRVEARLFYAAFHDDLTKLRNRAFFMDRVAVALDRAKADPRFRCAVLLLDLDRFALVNDSLGHRAGDRLLMEVAQRIRQSVRPQDTLARMGGDEFAVLVEGFDDMATVISLTHQIIQTIRRPIWIGEQEIFSSCSVGIVLLAPRHQLPEELLRDADIAMYQAKQNETDRYAIFASAMHESAVDALVLQTDLRNALARQEFFLMYQPICDAGTARIIGLEALIRWRHPQRGLVPPIAFIEAAEQAGLIQDIGRWVLREACAQMKIWHDRFPGLNLLLNVNSSGVELKACEFVSELRNTLESIDFDPCALQIEVTESIFLHNPEAVGAMLTEIRSMGVRIALDDFGTGYSSLSYLDRYQMDAIKIDRSFVASILTRQRTMAIVETIVKLAQALDLTVVAEGVEEPAQLEALRRTGCGCVQGYLLGRPMSVEDAERALQRQADACAVRVH